MMAVTSADYEAETLRRIRAAWDGRMETARTLAADLGMEAFEVLQIVRREGIPNPPKTEMAAARLQRLEAALTQPAPALKFCAYCEQTKPLDAFGLNKTAKDGRATRCKDCTNKAARADYARWQEERRKRETAQTPSATPPPPAPDPTPPPDEDGDDDVDYTALFHLLELLPNDAQWTKARRDRWLRAFEATLDLLIEVLGEEGRA